MIRHSPPELAPAWADAILAARLLSGALAPSRPQLGGIHVRARQGPALSAWLDMLRELAGETPPWIRIPATLEATRLAGGIDLVGSIEAGRPVYETGLLERARGGIAIISMAERLERGAVAIIGAAMDAGTAPVIVAIDEGADPDETLCAALADRLSLRIDLSAVSLTETFISPAGPDGSPPSAAAIGDDVLEALTGLAAAAAPRSMRLPLSLARTARLVAGLDGAATVSPEHCAAAIRLVLGLSPESMAAGEPEAAAEPPQEQPPEPEASRPDDRDDPQLPDPQALLDMLVEAEAARLPEIAAFFRHDKRRGGRGGEAGKAGASSEDGARGRPIGARERPTKASPRPDATATLRAAAPWQKLRGREAGAPPVIRKSDFRYRRLRQPRHSTTIFAVDASGSTALERLGEAKGAVELLLAECYVRRDEVALVAFRGDAAELLLEPTRSLVRAKRQLGGLPGGGATPLASGLMKSIEVASAARRKGNTPLVVLMTDGSGNVALDGTRDRAAAARDTEAWARRFAAMNLDCVVIDIARRDREASRELAAAMRADYCRLPRADAAAVSSVVAARLKAG